jgi:hypothetical protein
MTDEQFKDKARNPEGQDLGAGHQKNNDLEVTNAERIRNILDFVESLAAWWRAFDEASENPPPEVWYEKMIKFLDAGPQTAKALEKLYEDSGIPSGEISDSIKEAGTTICEEIHAGFDKLSSTIAGLGLTEEMGSTELRSSVGKRRNGRRNAPPGLQRLELRNKKEGDNRE